MVQANCWNFSEPCKVFILKRTGRGGGRQIIIPSLATEGIHCDFNKWCGCWSLRVQDQFNMQCEWLTEWTWELGHSHHSHAQDHAGYSWADALWFYISMPWVWFILAFFSFITLKRSKMRKTLGMANWTRLTQNFTGRDTRAKELQVKRKGAICR